MSEQSKSSVQNTQASLETCRCTTSPIEELEKKLKSMEIFDDLYSEHMSFALVMFFEREIERMRDGSWYHKKQKYRITYGNHLSGRSWEVCDEGVITVSNDDLIPRLVVQTDGRRKLGIIIMLENIVKIETVPEEKTVYRHEFFHMPDEAAPDDPADQYIEGRRHRGIKIRRHAAE